MVAFIPEFVQKVVDFKSYVKDFYRNDFNKIVGLGDKYLFKFYIEENGDDRGWLVMQYKTHEIDLSWLLHGPPIKMQSADFQGRP